MTILNVGGAYGRQYKSYKEVLKDWEEGKDFRSKYGYLSIRDVDKIKEDGYNCIAFNNEWYEIIALIRL